MKRTILLGLGLFILFGTEVWAGRLEANSRLGTKSDRLKQYGSVYYKTNSDATHIVRGKRGRKYARRFSLRENLKGDKAAVYDEFGYTPHRLRYNVAGRRTERWKYYSLGVEFHFDEDSNLIDTRYFPPEGNHID
jgi:hypothetical protein